MPLYSFKAKDNKEKVIEDVVQATSRTDAATILRSNDLKILTIQKVQRAALFLGKISTAEKASFCRFMASMMRAGLPLPQAVDVIRKETENKRLNKILFDVSFQVKKGSSLSSVLSTYKKDFGVVFLTMLKAGEESGTLDESFDYLSKQLLASYELTQKIKGSLMYPIVILFAMSANAIVMLLFVLPKLSDVFLELNVELPKTTELTLKFGKYVGENKTLVLSSVLVFGIVATALFLIEKTRKLFLTFITKFPIVNKLVNQIDSARFARTLSTLLRSGVPIISALDVSSEVITQDRLRIYAESFSKGVSTGASLSDLLDNKGSSFPRTMVQTIRAGEKTGSLDIVLEEMAQFYEMEIDFSLKRATALLEPVLMLLIGVAVGAMVLMMITPIYSLIGGFDSSF